MDSVRDSLQTAYADVLSFIGIKNCYFLYPDGKTGVVKPLKITETGWTVIAADKQRAAERVTGGQRFVIQTENPLDILEMPVEAVPCYGEALGENCLGVYSQGVYSYELSFPEPFPEWLERKIVEYRRIILSSEKRSEARYEVGLAGWKDFGLKSGEQRLLAGNKPVKALLNNVSIHGSLITAEQVPRESALVKAGKTMADALRDSVVCLRGLKSMYSRTLLWCGWSRRQNGCTDIRCGLWSRLLLSGRSGLSCTGNI
jgi:hypothetical protein